MAAQLKKRKQVAGSGGGDCNKCGAIYKRFYNFCSECGAKIEVDFHTESREERDNREEKEKPPPPLPREFSNILRAEVICEDEASFEYTMQLLLERPPPPPNLGRRKPSHEVGNDTGSRRPSQTLSEPVAAAVKLLTPPEQIEFRPVKVVSDNHGDRRISVFPRCASVLVTFLVGEYQRKGVETGPRQLVEVEVMFPWTKDARWIQKACCVDTADAPRRANLKKKRKIKTGAADVGSPSPTSPGGASTSPDNSP